VNAPLFHLELVFSLPYPSHLCHYQLETSLHHSFVRILDHAGTNDLQATLQGNKNKEGVHLVVPPEFANFFIASASAGAALVGRPIVYLLS
jgi:hypothetical protein